MKERVIADRYARALLRLAKKENIIPDARRGLDLFLSTLEQKEKLLTWLVDKEIAHLQRQKLVRELAGVQNIHPVVLKFIEVLIQKERVRFVFNIARLFNEKADEIEGIVRGTITVADKAAGDLAKSGLESALNKKLQKKIELKVVEDKSLIGGFTLHVGDKIWDASIKNRLESIKEILCQ